VRFGCVAAAGVFQIVPCAVLGVPGSKATSEKMKHRMGWSI
jgi:hypothetical protein